MPLQAFIRIFRGKGLTLIEHMIILFYISSAIAVISTALVITRTNAVHALLYLIVSLLAVALVFLALGASFAAMLEIIIYAGAIMVLFVFVIMMLNLGPQSTKQERSWLQPGVWRGPAALCAILGLELLWALIAAPSHQQQPGGITPREIGIALYGPYMLAVEIASMLLLAGLVGAYHLGRPEQQN